MGFILHLTRLKDFSALGIRIGPFAASGANFVPEFPNFFTFMLGSPKSPYQWRFAAWIAVAQSVFSTQCDKNFLKTSLESNLTSLSQTNLTSLSETNLTSGNEEFSCLLLAGDSRGCGVETYILP